MKTEIERIAKFMVGAMFMILAMLIVAGLSFSGVIPQDPPKDTIQTDTIKTVKTSRNIAIQQQILDKSISRMDSLILKKKQKLKKKE